MIVTPLVANVASSRNEDNADDENGGGSEIFAEALTRICSPVKSVSYRETALLAENPCAQPGFAGQCAGRLCQWVVVDVLRVRRALGRAEVPLPPLTMGWGRIGVQESLDLIGIGVFVVTMFVVAALAGDIGFIVGRGRAAVAEEQARRCQESAEQMRRERDATSETAEIEKAAVIEQARIDRESAVERVRVERDEVAEQARLDRESAGQQLQKQWACDIVTGMAQMRSSACP